MSWRQVPKLKKSRSRHISLLRNFAAQCVGSISIAAQKLKLLE
jgi:hypothetical protein